MKSLLIISLIFLLAVGAFAQEQSISIRGIKGLDNRSSDFTVDAGASRQAHNVDFGENVGAITKRKGYDSVSTLTAVDSIVDIYAAYYSDGTQQLFVIANEPDSGWGKIYVTNKGSVNLSSDSLTLIRNYWPITGRTLFAVHNDAVYISSSVAKGIVYNDGRTNDFPMRAPGEPLVVPITYNGIDSAQYGPKRGEYRYTISTAVVDNDTGAYLHLPAQTIGPISVDGAVMLRDFYSFSSQGNTLDSADGIQFYIWRSRANPGRLDGVDTAWLVGIKSISGDSIENAIVIDSLNDDSLGIAVFPTGLYDSSVLLLNREWAGLDSNGNRRANDFRYAAPGWVSSIDTATYTAGADAAMRYGIYRGVPTMAETLGFAYAWTLQDTITGFESDTSRSSVIFDTGALAWSNYISLPHAGPNDSGMVRNVYRSLIYTVSYDTAAAALYNNRFYFGIDEYGIYRRLQTYDPDNPYLAIDTVILTDFFLCKQLGWEDTLFTDAIRWDSITLNRRYTRRPAPPRFTAISTYDGRLFGAYGSRVYFSRLDSGGVWGAFDFISVGADDGDEITALAPTRNAMRVMKNNSMHNVYQNSNLDWSLAEITHGFGVVATKSVARGVGGIYYLTEFGVMRENEGQYLERTQAIELVSSPIDNLTNLPISTLRDARGFYHDQKYMLCVGDTTYVYDERANAWSTWGLTFSNAIHYGTEANVEFVPGDSMYFIKSGDSVLYRYGATTDNGAQIIMRWKSVPFFVDANEWNITSAALWYQNASASDTVWAIYYGDGQLTTADTSSFVSMASRIRTQRKGRASNNPYTFFQVGLQQKAASTSQLIIDGLDIYAQPVGREKIY